MAPEYEKGIPEDQWLIRTKSSPEQHKRNIFKHLIEVIGGIVYTWGSKWVDDGKFGGHIETGMGVGDGANQMAGVLSGFHDHERDMEKVDVINKKMQNGKANKEEIDFFYRMTS